MKKNLVFIVCLTILLALPAKASHLKGAEFNITPGAAANTFNLTLNVYRDCGALELCSSCPTSTAGCNMQVSLYGLDDPYNGLLIKNIQLTISPTNPITDIMNTCSQVKTICNNCGTRTAGTYSPGLERYTFKGVIDLNDVNLLCQNFEVGISACCRDYFSITTLEPVSASQNFYSFIRFNASLSNNSTPVFWREPLILVNSGENYLYNGGAYDADGDSLSYELSAALSAKNTSVMYKAPFSMSAPFPYLGFPATSPPAIPPVGFGIQGNTGIMQFRPTGTFLAVVAYNVKEWKKVGNNYVLASVTHREHPLMGYTTPVKPALNIKALPNTNNINGQLSYIIFVGQSWCKSFVAEKPGYMADSTDLMAKRSDSNFVISYSYNKALRNALGPIWDSLSVCVTPTLAMVRSQPYTFLLEGSDRTCPLKSASSTLLNIYVSPGPIVLHTQAASQVSNQSARIGGYISSTGQNTIDRKGMLVSLSPNPVYGGLGVTNYGVSNASDSVSMLLNNLTSLTKYYYRFYAGSNFYLAYGDVDSFVTSQYPSSLNLPDTLLLLATDSALLDAGSGMINPVWNYTVNNRFLYVKQSGMQRLCVAGAGNTQLCDSMQVILIKGIFPADTLLCQNSTAIHYVVAPAGVETLWEDGFTGALKTTLIKQPDTLLCRLKIGSYMVTDSAIVRVKALPPAKLTATKTALCNNISDTIMLKAPAGGAVYRWYKNGTDLNKVPTDSAMHVTSPGIYYLQVTASNGCSAYSDSMNINYDPAMSAAIGVSPQQSQCFAGNKFILTDKSAVRANRIWVVSSVYEDTAQEYQKSFATAGVYPVTLLLRSMAGCRDKAETTLTVYPSPVAAPITGQDRLVPLVNYTFRTQADSTLQYQWISNYGTFMSPQGRDSMQLQWNTANEGWLSVIVTNSYHCSDTSDRFQIYSLQLGIQSFGSNQTLRVYPNPGNGSFTVSWNQFYKSDCMMQIFDQEGKSVYEETKSVLPGKVNWPLDLSVSSGLYLLQIKTGDALLRAKVVVTE